MIRMFLRTSVLGLGLLALSCAAVSKTMGNVAKKAGVDPKPAQSAELANDESSDCEKLQTQPSIEEEYALGGAVALNWVQQGGGLIDRKANESLLVYLNTVGRNLGAQSPRPTLRWTFGVLQNDEAVNALSTPGGYVFVTRKLLQTVDNEAQLAGVLAHEIAHITQRHVLNQYAKVKVRQCKQAAFLKAGKDILSLGGSQLSPKVAESLDSLRKTWNGKLDLDHHVDLLGSFADDLVGDLANSGLDKEDEYAADEEAVRMLVSAGYDPMEYVTFLSRIPDSRGFFAHHPRSTDRKKKLVALLNANKGSDQEFSDFASNREGLVSPPLPPAFASLK
ncbi:M48 family metalloprotease [Hyalangium versicolor]|uniref:M48 family metalloprotease n=1 Tax=Hyalangium versicolor TaxID=2861190 RepID=UPI001CC96D6E|nr:M48 family metalloprotease [Hyalangium versicolor]